LSKISPDSPATAAVEGGVVARDSEIDPALVERLLAEAGDRDLLGEGGLLQQLTKQVLETALDAELTDHLGYERGDPTGRGSGNSRNSTSGKTVQTDIGSVDLAVPGDRNGTSRRGLCSRAFAGSRASTSASSPCTRAV
jgi:hypothetical protein